MIINFTCISSNQVPKMTSEEVLKNIFKGNIVPFKPKKKNKTYEMYKVCRRLKTSSGHIIKDFFLCVKCHSILNVKLTTHYNQLKRHYLACTGKVASNGQSSLMDLIFVSITFQLKFYQLPDTPIQITRKEFFPFIDGILALGAQYGIVSAIGTKLPSSINGQNR